MRLGRKTYLVDGAPDEQRPLFVAVSNTLVGGLTLVGGSLGVIAEVTSVPVLILTFLSLTALGMVVSWRMPEAAEMV